MELALKSMHSLNRRAKKYRDNRNEYRRAKFAEAITEEIAEIYQLKDAFLESIVKEGSAKVEYFLSEEGVQEWTCDCGNTWAGTNNECYCCGDYGHTDGKIWYIIKCGEYSFHTPQVSKIINEKATEIEPHDPTQPQKEILKIGLTIAAQKACVKLLVERFRHI
jgi:hypothetical protein